MAYEQPLKLFALDALKPLPLADLAAQCAARLAASERLVTLFGRPAAPHETPGTRVTAIFQPPDAALVAVRSHAAAQTHYPALTADFPAAQIFERELWEQTGLVPEGHPWLKPVRFEGPRQQRMDEYPFFKVRGQEVHEVGVGPVHAGVIEPGHFRFMCHGEKVHHLEIQLGYQHRGIESLLLQRPATALTPLIESIAGDSAVANAWAYCAALEALSGQVADLRVQISRAVALEMERIAIHVATLIGLATDIAYLQPAASYGRLRTAIINASQRVCGNRFGRGWMRPGSARALTPALCSDLVRTLAEFLADFDEVSQLTREAHSVKARFKGTGAVSLQAASDLGLTGVVARASGVMLDARSQLPGAVYGQFPLPLLTEFTGDCWARMQLRMREVQSSVQWLIKLLQQTGDGAPAAARAPEARPWRLAPHALCVSLAEGVRGPVVHVLETDAQGALLHYKVQDPSLANWFGLAWAVRNNGISDFPICNKSFDLSYCGNDL
ncbi:MAG: NADH-quinone oxidoreductase subunit C [Rhodoferax sp.]|nr:NADH-quinone oxidoreductase subunit C [Rhodoferax sp.]